MRQLSAREQEELLIMMRISGRGLRLMTWKIAMEYEIDIHTQNQEITGIYIVFPILNILTAGMTIMNIGLILNQQSLMSA